MQKILCLMILLSAVLSDRAIAQDASIFPRGEVSNTDNHTGTVWLNELSGADSVFNYSIAVATFAPGAKLDWHIHPAGQVLLITEGTGYYQEKGKPIQIVHKGDVIKCLPGISHWHGASPKSSFAYVATTPTQKGKTIWQQRVTDEEYNRVNGETKQSMNTNQSLDSKQQSIVTISAFTATGDLVQLQNALNDGLDAGLTVNEIKEVIVQLYAYSGFPRSLNALQTFMHLLKERKQKGLKDELGKAANPLPADKTKLQFGTAMQTRLVGQPVKGEVYEFAPAIDQFLKEHLFGDIFGRDNLDWKTRELATISALAALGGVENQLRSHFSVGRYNGLTDNQLNQLVSIIQSKVGSKEGNAANQVLETILKQKQDNKL